jgi:hypothetical protein
VIEKKGFWVLAGSVTASQLIIMTLGFAILSGYLYLFTGKVVETKKEEKSEK